MKHVFSKKRGRRISPVQALMILSGLASAIAVVACSADDNPEPSTPVISGGAGGTSSAGAGGSSAGKGGSSAGGSAGISGTSGAAGETGSEGGAGGESGSTGEGGDGGEAGTGGGAICTPGSTGPGGCFLCPSTGIQYLNQCTDSQCSHFDNARLLYPGYTPGGALPPLP
jgi:hypothetical protein